MGWGHMEWYTWSEDEWSGGMRGMGTRVSRSIAKDTWYSSSLFPPPLLSVSDTTTRTVPFSSKDKTKYHQGVSG